MVNSVVMLCSLMWNRAISTSRSKAPHPDRLRYPTSPRKSGARLASSRFLAHSPAKRSTYRECRPAPSPRSCGERVGVRGKPQAQISLLRLAGVLDGLEGREFDVVELAVDLLYLADVDVLHDVAGFRIDRDRAARAFPLHPLHGLDQTSAVGLAAGLLERLVDQMDAVIAAD